MALDAEPIAMPIRLTGGILRCCRCLDSYSPTGWRVRPLGEGDVCFSCAHRDQELHPWQAFCEVANTIDDVMQAAEDTETRQLMALMFADTARHFARWRDTPPDISEITE